MVSFKRVVATIAASVLVAGSLAACSSAEDGPSVYFLNFKPESEQAFKDIAAAYTKKTGVNVKVVTAASGTYEQTLKSEVAKSNPPTLFNLNGPVGYGNWKDYASDLSDADFTKLVQQRALEAGLLLLSCGVYGNVIRFLFPLTIEDAVFEEGLAILQRALEG